MRDLRGLPGYDAPVSDDTGQRSEASIRRRQTVRVVAILVLLAIAVSLAVDNAQEVEIGWVFGDLRAPLVAALAVAFALGGAVGLLVARRQQRR